MKNLILVDTSYTSFYRYFATVKWISYSDKKLYAEKTQIKNYDWGENLKFIEKYNKMYLESISKLVGKNVFANSEIIFCMDSPQETLWRNQLDDNYKGSRVDLALKHNFKNVFKNTYQKLIPSLVSNNKNIHSIRIPQLEADDIIGTITKYYEKKYPKINVYVVSNDTDFLQLGRANLFICNYKQKKVISMNKNQATIMLNYKIINGDKSDNIDPIYPRLKTSVKEELAKNNAKLKQFLISNTEAKLKYKLNKKLIDFNEIPRDMQKIILKNFFELKLKNN